MTNEELLECIEKLIQNRKDMAGDLPYPNLPNGIKEAEEMLERIKQLITSETFLISIEESY